jgi:rhomboid family GlyGly-CTERM serine protease
MHADSNQWKPWEFMLPAVIVVLACTIACIPSLTAAWELDRAAVAGGEVWRVVTGHLTHWNGDHLFWDAATFLALGVVCMKRSPIRTVLSLLIGSVAISAAVLAAHAELTTYRGLSGLDTALFTLLAVMIYQDARRDGDRALGAVTKWALAALLAKVGYEIATGQTLFVDSKTAGFEPLASAHAVGAAVGLVVAVASPAISAIREASRPAVKIDIVRFSRPNGILR